MQVIANLIAKFVQKLIDAVAWIGQLFVKVFVALWDMVRDAACWVFEQSLEIAITALNAFDFTALTSQAGAWAGLPAQVLEVLAAVGLTTCLGLIVTAIGIRLMLQLIPFTRLGS